MAEISQNISETLKSIHLKTPDLSTLAKKGSDSVRFYIYYFTSSNRVQVSWKNFPS